MCGIGGVLKTGRIDRISLDAMAGAMAHRGPDDQGIEVVSPDGQGDGFSLGLVHRRLSIIDLSDAAHQPMLDEQTGNWIVFNGEIYNFGQIRADAENKGCKFKSNSDTEAILKAYHLYGVDCLKKLRGMFAFAIWDNKQKRLFLAVDRFGIKPLYFYHSPNDTFVFASELRAVLKSGLVGKKIEHSAVDSFLAYGAIQAPLTMVNGVFSLLPAQYMLYKPAERSKKIVQYWNVPENGGSKPVANPREAASQLREVLQDSIHKHLVSDVPVGLFLSGGIDSSSVVAMANEFNKGALRSFSVVFSEADYSEAKYSRIVAERHCKNHTEIMFSVNDLLKFLPDALRAMDQPTVDGINVYTISKVVRESGIKVVLSGQGGDEVFGGYPTFEMVTLMKKMHTLANPFPCLLRRKLGDIIDALRNRSIIKSKISQILDSDGDILSLYLIVRQLFSPTARRHLLLNGDNKGTFNGLPLQVAESLTKEIARLDVFGKISWLELRLYLANMLLRDGDFMSMAHGLEVRVPFLDHEVAEFVAGVAPEIKSRSNLPKPLLVNAMGGLLPEQVYRRPKMGFTFPWEIWLRGRLRDQVDSLFNEFSDDNELGLNMTHCRKMWQMFLSKAPGITWVRVWAIYVLMSWYRIND